MNRLIPLVAAIVIVAAAAGAVALAGSAPPDSPGATPIPTPVPTLPPTPVPTLPPEPDPTPAPSDLPPDDGLVVIDLATADGHSVRCEVMDRSGRLVRAASGQPGSGASVAPYELRVENVDDRTLRLTWVDYPIDNELTLFIDEGRLVLVQPAPTADTDAIAFDRVLLLEFDRPIAASNIETFLQDGLDV